METLDKAAMGRRIKEIRKKAGLRQWQLAEQLGTTQSAVHKYEHGVIPEPRRLVKLARLGETTIEWILTGQHWEDGSTSQERLPADIYRLAERLQALGSDQRRQLDDALKILSEAAGALSAAGTGNDGAASAADLASQISLLSEKHREVLTAALRVHRAVQESVLDLAIERLAGSPSRQSRTGGSSSRGR